MNKDGVVEYRAVKIGKLFGKYRAIEGGLKDDDNVVYVGLQRAVPGIKVDAKPAKIQ